MQEPKNEWRSPLTGDLVSYAEAERHKHELAGWAPVEHVPAEPVDDVVNHPSHYNRGKIEVIDFIEDQGLDFATGSAVKYLVRAGHKDPATEEQDLRKAIWLIERRISNL